MNEQECIPVGCVPPANRDPRGQSPTPPNRDPLDRAPPKQKPPVNRITDWCMNITLPETSFSGGNYPFKLEPSIW